MSELEATLTVANTSTAAKEADIQGGGQSQEERIQDEGSQGGSEGGIQEGPLPKKSKTSEEKGDSPYPFAKLRSIRIFSEREINGQDAEMTRVYWKFWNTTAEELCSDGAYNDWGKRDLKLYIDAAWIIHKTHLQELREKDVRESIKELQVQYGSSELPVKLRTEDENVTELLAQVLKLGNILTSVIQGFGYNYHTYRFNLLQVVLTKIMQNYYTILAKFDSMLYTFLATRFNGQSNRVKQ